MVRPTPWNGRQRRSAFHLTNAKLKRKRAWRKEKPSSSKRVFADIVFAKPASFVHCMEKRGLKKRRTCIRRRSRFLWFHRVRIRPRSRLCRKSKPSRRRTDSRPNLSPSAPCRRGRTLLVREAKLVLGQILWPTGSNHVAVRSRETRGNRPRSPRSPDEGLPKSIQTNLERFTHSATCTSTNGE